MMGGFLLAEEVGLEPTNPVRGSTFQEWCNSRYAIPPNEFYDKKPIKSIFNYRLSHKFLIEYINGNP